MEFLGGGSLTFGPTTLICKHCKKPVKVTVIHDETIVYHSETNGCYCGDGLQNGPLVYAEIQEVR
jgi:hypothetical protein